MDKNEKDAQRALGTESVFAVTVVVPVVGNITLRKEVMATSEEDAIERIKQIEMMTPPNRLAQELSIRDNGPGYYGERTIESDKSKPKQYTARRIPQDDGLIKRSSSVNQTGGGF